MQLLPVEEIVRNVQSQVPGPIWDGTPDSYQGVMIASARSAAELAQKDAREKIAPLLLQMEWQESIEYDTARPNDPPYRMMRCPSCQGVQPKDNENRHTYEGHNHDCALAELLEALSETVARTLGPTVMVAPPLHG